MALPRNANQPSVVSTETRAIAANNAAVVRLDTAEATLLSMATHEARIASLETEPPNHAATHLPGGADDILVVSESTAGWCPPLSGVATEYLDGTGAWSTPAGGGGGGVTDHGALTGLADDDHTQYVLADGTRASWPTPTSTAAATKIVLSGADGRIDNQWCKNFNLQDFVNTSAGPGYDSVYPAGLLSGVALGTVTMTANRSYLIPFLAPKRPATLNNVYMQVTTLVAGNLEWRLYDSKSDASGVCLTSDLRPTGFPIDGTLTAIAATGPVTFAATAALTPGRLYWIGVRSTTNMALRAVTTNQALPILGFPIPTGTTVPAMTTHLYQALALGNPYLGTEAWTRGSGSFPAVFLRFGT